jgi:pseudaminic acid biosynthesis-associated methylase
MKTQQIEFWSGEFGRDYTERNTIEQEDWNANYLKNYGATRRSMNNLFLNEFPKDFRILEVGSNTGHQLLALQQNGFNNLYGIELQFGAVSLANKLRKNIHVVQASGFEIPFEDESFDLVFTSGVLIHIAPLDLPVIMSEIHRCSSRYIWGFEYYSEIVREINYRGNTGVLWKSDYASLFMKSFSDLTLKKKIFYPYINDKERNNVDCMYLLEKRIV